MSDHNPLPPGHAPQDGHAHGQDQADVHGPMEMHFSLKGYTIGFLLSVVLTAIPFWLVMAKVIPGSTATAVVILGFAVVQIVVHIVYFLHMDRSPEQRSNVQVGLFSVLIIGIVVVGSLWVMHNMNINMMP